MSVELSKKVRRYLRKILGYRVFTIVSKIFPNIDIIISQLYRIYLIKTSNIRHSKAIRRIRNKNKIKVVFFQMNESVWKYKGIYDLMLKNQQFEPTIVVVPNTLFGEDLMLNNMHLTFDGFQRKGYKVINSYNSVNQSWLDVKKVINPDIVFFSIPYDLTREDYYINNFMDTLTCYVPYFFGINILYGDNYNTLFHNLLWKAFYETPIHKEFALKYSQNKGINVVVSGYPGLDIFYNKDVKTDNPWKIKDEMVKRVIWAPHHTIEGQGGTLNYSNFLKYSEFFIEFALKYKNSVQIAFKPHPNLKPKLFLDKNWGTKRANNYYNYWNEIDNGFLVESDYFDLFLTSDALIHDCGSFMIEYLTIGKPVLYLIKDVNLKHRFNKLGQIALNKHYHALKEQDILDFVEGRVLNSNDIMVNERKDFCNKYLIQSHGVRASEFIYNHLLEELQITENRFSN